MTNPYAIIAGPALDGEPNEAEHVDIIQGPTVAESVLTRPGRRRGRTRESPRAGRFVLWLLRENDTGTLLVAGAEPLQRVETDYDVACVGECEWSFVEPSQEAVAQYGALNPGTAPSRGAPAWGFIQYKMADAWTLEPAPVAQIEVPAEDPMAGSLLFEAAARAHCAEPGRQDHRRGLAAGCGFGNGSVACGCRRVVGCVRRLAACCSLGSHVAASYYDCIDCA